MAARASRRSSFDRHGPQVFPIAVEKHSGRVAPSRYPTYRSTLMQHAQRFARPGPVANAVPANSLRSEMDRRRGLGTAFTLKEAVAIVVPLCTDVAERHLRGERLFVHPSSIVLAGGLYPQVSPELSRAVPSIARD